MFLTDGRVIFIGSVVIKGVKNIAHAGVNADRKESKGKCMMGIEQAASGLTLISVTIAQTHFKFGDFRTLFSEHIN